MVLALLDKQRGLTPPVAQLSPQVSALTREQQGATVASKALTNALVFTAHQFNVVRNMSNLQMAFLAEDLLSLYWDWRFDEFLYVLREGVRQNWGKTFDRLDPPTMHEWCKAYAVARTVQIEGEAYQAHVARKKAEVLPTRSELSRQAGYHELRAQLDKLDNQTLVNGEAYYQALPARTVTEDFKLAVATELANERRRAYYLERIGRAIVGDEKDYETYAVELSSERTTREKAQDHALELALALGDRAAAGLPAQPVPGLYSNLSEAPAFGATSF